ncbi:unnamed protein product [Diplocarpon coronariae]
MIASTVDYDPSPLTDRLWTEFLYRCSADSEQRVKARDWSWPVVLGAAGTVRILPTLHVSSTDQQSRPTTPTSTDSSSPCKQSPVPPRVQLYVKSGDPASSRSPSVALSDGVYWQTAYSSRLDDKRHHSPGAAFLGRTLTMLPPSAPRARGREADGERFSIRRFPDTFLWRYIGLHSPVHDG